MIFFVLLLITLSAPMFRWLRVAQREHYLPGRVTAIALLWARSRPDALLLVVALLLVCVISTLLDLSSQSASGAILAVCAAIGSVAWPVGLRWRGRGKPLVFTRRLTRLAVLVCLVSVALAIGGWYLVRGGQGEFLVLLMTLLRPTVVDFCLIVLAPIERWLSTQFVRSAETRIREVRPTIVAITGSFGKTSTKLYTAHLLRESFATVASPGSFNNLLGLSRAVNDTLTASTEVFVAEMGTYGPGEIETMCRYFPPSIACITSIGDVHLERMKSRARIAEAKSEILREARTLVLCVDYPELRDIARREASAGREVITVTSNDETAAVVKVLKADNTITLSIKDVQVARVSSVEGHPGNIGCAVAVALAMGVAETEIVKLLPKLPRVPHRAETVQSGRSPYIIDDTYNSNPQGAMSALDQAMSVARSRGGHAWVITPGMVELGRTQAEANKVFASNVVSAGAQLVIVGYVNRRALISGVEDAGDGAKSSKVLIAAHRSDAQEYLNDAGPDDVVLYENDLPDHYP